MTTYYDVLGIVPGSDAMEINKAFNAGIREQLDSIDYPRGSMWWWPRLTRIKALTEAMETLSNDERRSSYHKTLSGAGLVCSMCDGMGNLQFGKGSFNAHSWNSLKCEACKGTGKGFEIHD